MLYVPLDACCEVAFVVSRHKLLAHDVETARVVLHTSLMVLVTNLMCVPYTAVITAHEHMDAYAYISVLEAVLKLAVAFGVWYAAGDRLAELGYDEKYGARPLRKAIRSNIEDPLAEMFLSGALKDVVSAWILTVVIFSLEIYFDVERENNKYQGCENQQ